MNKFLVSNKLQYRMARTILQAIVGFLIANMAEIVAVTQLDGNIQAIIVSVTMVILAPIMKALGVEDERIRDENRGDIDAE